MEHHIIEHWSVVIYKNNCKPQVVGLTVNHPNIPDGLMATSFVISVCEKTGLVQTLNSTYRLGTKDPKFDQWLQENNVFSPEGFTFRSKKRKNTALILPHLNEMYSEGITSINALAEKWLSTSDWHEIHPGVPMSWLTSDQHLELLKKISTRTAQRMREKSSITFE